ncbi:MAG: hypothetical protein M3015_02415 [Bacteroidota bacterium]|nr:hypothetical protein [Bacteroidota bacterium]
MLVQTLVRSEKNSRYNHQHGCFAVSNEMELYGLKDKFALAIIDNDKKRAKYLSKFIEISNIENELKLYKHEERHQYYIEVNPAMEVWILKICKQEGIDILIEFDLPRELKELKRITKAQASIKDRRFIELFLKLEKSNNRSMLKLKTWIKLLKEKNYTVDINELINA